MKAVAMSATPYAPNSKCANRMKSRVRARGRILATSPLANAKSIVMLPLTPRKLCVDL